MITNEQELDKAIQEANLAGKPAHLNLTGLITISKSYTIKVPLSLHGQDCWLKYKGGTLYWNSLPMGWYALKGAAMGEVVLTDAPVERGYYIICQSNDKIAVEPHTKGGTQHPHEIHLVNYKQDKSVGLESVLVDTIDGNVSLLNPLDGIVVEGINAICEGVQVNYATAMRFDGVTNLKIQDVRFTRNGPGAIWLNNAYNCVIRDCRIDGTMATDNVYGIVVGTVNNVFISDCLITGCRHAFTTTAGVTKGVARWGTPQNVILNNCIINVPSKLELKQTRVGLDTHAEGYGILFRNCEINLGSSTTNYGAFIRSRNVRFIGCTFNGNGATKGIELYGPNGSVENCTFNNMWYGVATKKIYSTYSHNASVFNCTFNNLSGPAVYFETGANHKIHNLALNGVMKSPGSKFKDFKVAVIGDYTEI